MLPAFPIRRTIIVLCGALAGIAAPLPVVGLDADSAAAATARNSVVLSSFTLGGSNGFDVEGVGVRGGGFPRRIAVAAKRGSTAAIYRVDGDGEPGLHGVFGDLGTMDLSFKRETRTAEQFDRGCRIVTETGTFEGDFSFTGEGGYTSATATSVSGLRLTLPKDFCGFLPRKGSNPGVDRADQLVARAPRVNGYIEVTIHRGSVLGTGLYATVHETLGPMSIERSLSSGRGTSFKLARGKPPRRAWAKPAKPFDGAARYIDPRGAPARWTGSLSASFPGLPAPVPLAGPSFAVRLCPNTALLKSCRVRLPKNGASAQSSGSQSPARGVARLSWSR